MQPLDDYPIGADRNAGSSPPAQERNWRTPVMVGVCAAIVAAAAAFFLMRPSNDPGTPAPDVAETGAQQRSPQTRVPLGPVVEPRDLPPLDLTDPLVRELLSTLSSRPELAAWLATDGLVRNLAASIDNVARGTTPSAHLRRLAPQRPFIAEPRGDEFVIDPRSYRRYDGIAETVAALDADGLARAYVTLRPRLREAYRDLGYPDGNIDAAVERAITRLLSTPVLQAEVDVRPAPVLYRFSDERIEMLTPAQKQLLRMGPRNVRVVQAKLREVARALGIRFPE